MESDAQGCIKPVRGIKSSMTKDDFSGHLLAQDI
jgi:hypothetical protein